MAKLTDILVYEWEAWDGFLIGHLAAEHCRVPAAYDDAWDTLESRLSPNIKAVLLQINLSRQQGYPRQRNSLIANLKARGIRVLNEHVTDISKSALHRRLEDAGIRSARADIGVGEDTALFVKSNLNWGGEVERRLSEAIRRKLFGERAQRITAFDQYYRTTKSKLHPDAWHDESIVIEKYISNSENSFYRVYAFGEALVAVKAHNNALVKKISSDIRDRNVLVWKEDLRGQRADLPDDLQRLLLSFMDSTDADYYCLDIMHDLRNFYIVDMNTTPYSGTGRQVSEACAFLRDGARALLQ